MLLLVAGCAGGGEPDAAPSRQQDSGAPSPDLGQPAATLGADPAQPTTTSLSAGGSAPVRTSGPAAAGSTGTAATPARIVAAIPDPASDAGSGSPGYGDLRSISFADLGDAVRVVVEVAADVPSRLPTGEVEGMGVDIFRGTSFESSHQLFADGGATGWTAYLQGPDGFVEYPGSFEVGGRTLVFEVPWSAIGGRGALRASAFADTSRSAASVNLSWSDAAPDSGTVDVRP
jgi:hypothetical protein